jgi:hypothetical protein
MFLFSCPAHPSLKPQQKDTATEKHCIDACNRGNCHSIVHVVQNDSVVILYDHLPRFFSYHSQVSDPAKSLKACFSFLYWNSAVKARRVQLVLYVVFKKVLPPRSMARKTKVWRLDLVRSFLRAHQLSVFCGISQDGRCRILHLFESVGGMFGSHRVFLPSLAVEWLSLLLLIQEVSFRWALLSEAIRGFLSPWEKC